MPKVSINILTKNRAPALHRALTSIAQQSFRDFEVVVVNDGSMDETAEILSGFNPSFLDFKIINHKLSLGITQSRQEALLVSTGEYVAILDDDDEWLDADKLKKQVEFLDTQKEYVLVGGGIKIESGIKSSKGGSSSGGNYELRMRPSLDKDIRKTMLLKNNFFTSTVMFRREVAIKAGGFKSDGVDLAEDYDLWLRLGTQGKMYNFSEVFTNYTQNRYNKDKFQRFLSKQLSLVVLYSKNYPYSKWAKLLLKLRMLF
jgi:glycosyltransferase involved in cell wall biosynthesis